MAALPPEVERVNPPEERTSAGVRAIVGAVFVVGGLGLIVCGGLFLMGAMALVAPDVFNPGVPTAPLSAEAVGLLYFLYALAGACFLGALAMFGFAVRGLLRIFAER